MRRIDLETPRGRFAALAAGPDDGPLLLCQHGFPDTPRGFEGLTPHLVEAGFRVVAPSLRGYAPSPTEGRFTLAELAADLAACLDAASDPGQPRALFGHDWGAAIAWTLLERRPDAVQAAAIASVPRSEIFARNAQRSPAQLLRSAYMLFFNLPRIPELTLRRTRLIERLWRRWSPGLEPSPELLQETTRCVRESLPGPLRPYRAVLRDVSAARQLRSGEVVPIATPVLYLHGAVDGCIAANIARGQADTLSGAYEEHVLDGLGHFLHVEAPERVGRHLIDFFDAHLKA